MQLDNLKVLETLPIASWPYPRILVCIPLERSLSYADLVFWPFMKIAMQGPAFAETSYSARIDVMRNQFVKQLLMSSFTHLLMLDNDHKHPEDIIQMFARWPLLYPEMRVISGLNFRRSPPFDPVAGNLTDVGKRPIMLEWREGIIEIDEVGAASLFVDRSVFEQLEPPWFYNDYSRVWENNWPGEDLGFCKKCRDANIPIYIDTTISSPHCAEVFVTEQTFRDFVRANPEKFKDV